MSASKAIVFSAMASTLAICIAAPLFVLHASPFMQPGQDWRTGFLAGEDLRLLDSGRYLEQPWCDICPYDEVKGNWRRSGNLIVLTSVSPAKGERRLREVTVDGCPMLIPVRKSLPDQPLSYTGALTHPGDHCAGRLRTEDPTERLLRDSE